MFLKRASLIALSILIVMLIAACGSSTSSGGGPYGSSGSNSPATPPPTSGSTSPPAVVHTATVTVRGQSEIVLTDDTRGLTLYYFTPDSATQSACTGSCAQAWPPLLFSGSGDPTSSTSLSGKLSVQMDANGNQVEYNGHLLYTYSGDTAPGQTNGEGLLGKWFVANPDLAVQGTGSTNGG